MVRVEARRLGQHAGLGESGSKLPHSKPYCFTRKGTLLESVPLPSVTCTVPLVAPAGTTAPIREFEITLKTAGVPLKLTPVAPVEIGP